MKKVIGILCIALLMGSLTLSAAAQQATWGNSGAKPAPVKGDSGSGYWWWPLSPQTEVSKTEVWGNHGIVYSKYSVPAPPKATPPPAPPVRPPAPAPAPVIRSAPVFNETLFGFDSSTLTDQGKSDLSVIASYMKENSGDTLEVQGHTCDVNNSGDPQYNEKLGLRRAESVEAALVGFGVVSSRLSAVSYGDSKPAVPNDSSANRALNRRVVFLFSLAQN